MNPKPFLDYLRDKRDANGEGSSQSRHTFDNLMHGELPTTTPLINWAADIDAMARRVLRGLGVPAWPIYNVAPEATLTTEPRNITHETEELIRVKPLMIEGETNE